MKFLFDNIPVAVVIAGICMLMLYPYIGAGLLLAALCFEAEQYVLMVVSFLICVLLQSIMGKHIKPHHVQIPPSRASRAKRLKKKKRRKDAGAVDPVQDAGSGDMDQPAGHVDTAQQEITEGDSDGESGQ